jgi:hypothetical protein
MCPKLDAFFGFLDKFRHPFSNLPDNDSLGRQQINGLKFKFLFVHEPRCLAVRFMNRRCFKSELIFLHCPEIVEEVIRVDPDAGLAIVGEETAFLVDYG